MVNWRYAWVEEAECTHLGGGLDQLRLTLSIAIASRSTGVEAWS